MRAKKKASVLGAKKKPSVIKKLKQATKKSKFALVIW
jgi:hypothetical protein